MSLECQRHAEDCAFLRKHVAYLEQSVFAIEALVAIAAISIAILNS